MRESNPRLLARQASTLAPELMWPVEMVEAPGLEPGLPRSKRGVLPLDEASMVRSAGLEPACRLGHCVLSAARLPNSARNAGIMNSQISGRAVPSRFHVLEKQLAPRILTLAFAPTRIACWMRLRASRRGITGAQCDARVRTLSQNHVVKQQPAPSRRHRGVSAKARDASRGLYLAAESLLGWFSPNLRYLSWRGLPAGGSSGLRLQSLEALEAVTYRV